MVSEERQRIIETNRSLRLIKTELENLLEKGVITDDAYDTFHRLLPSETSARQAAASPAPTSAPTPPVASLAALSIDRPVTTATAEPSAPPGPPPSYPQPSASAPPPLEKSGDYGNPYQAPPGPPPAWGQNNGYYQPQNSGGYYQPPAGPPPTWGQNNGSYYQQQNNSGYYQPPSGPPPQQQNPYNSSTPPMAVANQEPQKQEEQKTEGGSNKFKDGAANVGKKFGNATIFGAGATLGGNLMNSLF